MLGEVFVVRLGKISVSWILCLSAMAPCGGTEPGMIPIPKGCFQMGSNQGDKDERPVHEVCLDGFLLDRTETTNADFDRIMGRNPHLTDGTCFVWNGGAWARGALPNSFLGRDQPAVCVDHDQAEDYCRTTGKRLPTEAEWEYAARAGGPDPTGGSLGRSAWYRGNSDGRTHPVGRSLPNAWGLLDMLGNAWEWVDDRYEATYYGSSPSDNPPGPASGAYRVYRGGGWFSPARDVRASIRGSLNAQRSRSTLGFRCAESP